MTEREATEVRREYGLMIRQKAKEARELRGRVLRKYQESVMAGRSEEECRELVLTAFDREGLTERRLQNILERSADFGNPKLNAYTEARIAVWLSKMENDVDERRDEIDKQLDTLDESDDQDWVEVEETDTTGVKFSGVSTKKRPVWDIKLELKDQKIKSLERYFNAVKALRGSQPLLNVVNNVIHTDETAQDLALRIKALEKMQHITNGVTIEAPQAGDAGQEQAG